MSLFKMNTVSHYLHNGTDSATSWNFIHLFLIILIISVAGGNLLVLITVICDQKLRSITTNKFIASLAVSDLMVGLIVMPMSLYMRVNDDHWGLGHTWCQLHLISGVCATTASIVHLVAISLDRYFAIMFPTEYQRHSISTSAIPYIIMIWLMSLAVSCTLFMENTLDANGVCWIENPQYLVLSAMLSFFLPGAIVVYLYVKIFRKLRSHQLYMFAQTKPAKKAAAASAKIRRSLPQVIIEEVRSRRGSRMSQSERHSDSNGSPTRSTSQKSERSPSQPEIHAPIMQRKWRSPTICAETLEYDRLLAAKKRVSICADPPSIDMSSCQIVEIQEDNESSIEMPSLTLAVPTKTEVRPLTPHSTPLLTVEKAVPSSHSAGINVENLSKRLNRLAKPTSFLVVPAMMALNTPPLSPMLHGSSETMPMSLTVPKLWDCPTPATVSSGNSSHSSYTSASTERRISMHSYGSSLTDGTDSTYELDSRRSSSWSAIKTATLAHKLAEVQTSLANGVGSPTTAAGSKKSSSGGLSRGKLRRIASQVTRAIRRKRRESIAIRRESRATRVVAAILVAFLICWLPYFLVSVYRGISTGFAWSTNRQLHIALFHVTAWLGFAHSCFNPIIYMCLNKNFRRTVTRVLIRLREMGQKRRASA